MLIISRKSGESFIIGDGIKVSVLEVSSDKIKIGIDAPRDVKILRSEVFDTTAANKEAVNTHSITLEELRKNLVK